MTELRRQFARVLLATALLLMTGLSSPRAADQVIFYVSGESAGYELRIYHPLRGTRTLLELPGEPTNVYWTEDFETITFRIGDDFLESDWRIGSKARQAISLPAVSGDAYRDITAWYDIESQAWRYYEIQYPADDAKVWNYFARVFQYNEDTGDWDKLTGQATHGCEQGDGSACGYEVREYTTGRDRHVFWTRLAEEMRLGSIMDEVGLDYEDRMEGKDLWFRLGGTELSVVPAFGDSLHAMAPLKWRKGGEPKVVFPTDLEYPCSDQLGLTRFGRFLLVASEWRGGCGRVIDLDTGQTVHELPASATHAVVVPWRGRE